MTDKIFNYLPWINITFSFDKADFSKWWFYTDINSIKNKSIFVDNINLLKSILKKAHNFRLENKNDEKFLIKNFFAFLIEVLISQEKKQLLSHHQKIYLMNLEIDLFIDEYYFIFSIFDKNKNRLDWDFSTKFDYSSIENIHFILKK